MRYEVPARIWSRDEAEAAIPLVRDLLAEGRDATSTFRDAQAQMEDLRIVHGHEVTARDHPAHDEWAMHRRRMQDARRSIERVADRFEARGIALKDIELGLVDFPAQMGDEVVFLCWKDGEDRIEAWHPVETGFAGRRPVPDDITGR